MSRLRGLGRAWDRISIYLPIMLMGLLALGTYWLARSTPVFAPPAAEQPPTHEPDYFLRRFSVKSFDAAGQLQSEMLGAEARHYPDTDTLEIDQPRIRSYDARGALITATARRAISNGDGSQVQLIGEAVVTRTAQEGPGRPEPPLEIRGELLHFFVEEERIVSGQPVTLLRGPDRLQGERLEYDHRQRVLQLRGKVRGSLQPRAAGG